MRVLLVEDSPGDASLVSAALGRAGIDVQWVETLADAVAAVAGDLACVLVDLGLPDAEGLDVVDAMRSATPDVPVVVLTGRESDDLAVDAIRHGADDYLLKSELSSRELHRVVAYAVERARERSAFRHLAAESEAVMQAVSAALFVLDRDGRVTSVNAAAVKLFGPDAAAVYERPGDWPRVTRSGDVVPLDELPAQQALTTGRSSAVKDLGIVTPDGTCWVDVVANPLCNEHGAVHGAVVSMQDVSDRHAAEESARFREALLAAVGQAVIGTDAAGTVLFWNPAAERLYGWSAAEAVGRPILDLAPSRRSAQQAHEMQTALARGESWTGDFEVHRKDGTTFPAMVTNSPVYDEHGHLTAILGVSADITERKRAEEAAQALSAIVTGSVDAIYTKSVDGRILSWNRGAERLYGYAAEDIVGQPVTILDRPGADEAARLLALAVAGEAVSGVETLRRRRDGSLIAVSLTLTPMRDDDGNVTAVSVIARDISERRALEEELRTQALYDVLTGLPNRTLLDDRLASALRQAARTKQPVAVLFCDLDQFKRINDSYGHLVGDGVLTEAAARLMTTVRPSDTVARFGGDEFVVVCSDTGPEQAREVATRMADALRAPMVVDGQRHHVSASIGIAISPPLEPDAATLLSQADAAMYEAKAGGRARAVVFDLAMAAETMARQDLANELREALEQGELAVHYQPQVTLADGALAGLEALVRWEHPVHGWVPPAVFVPIAEEHGFCVELDEWVLARACTDMAQLRKRGLIPPSARVAVNRSARGIADPELVTKVVAATTCAGLPIDAVEIEVTETALMTDLDAAVSSLRRLRELGAGVALDDFGTGYSSLTYVRQLPVSAVKIDRTFIQHIVDEPDDLAISSSIIDLGRALGLRTIAEGVETSHQRGVLRRLGCADAQGYLWAQPLPFEELSALLQSWPTVDPVDVELPGRSRRSRSPMTNEHGLHMILQMHKNGGSLHTIAAALNAQGFRTPTETRWHAKSVARVIADRVSPAPLESVR